MTERYDDGLVLLNLCKFEPQCVAETAFRARIAVDEGLCTLTVHCDRLHIVALVRNDFKVNRGVAEHLADNIGGYAPLTIGGDGNIVGDSLKLSRNDVVGVHRCDVGPDGIANNAEKVNTVGAIQIKVGEPVAVVGHQLQT